MTQEHLKQSPAVGTRADLATYADVCEFVYGEAALLDEGRFAEWLTLVDERIHYFIPVRITTMRGEGSDLSVSAHIDDYYPALKARVNRMLSRDNWAENPSSRMRHHVSNVTVRKVEGPEGEDRLAVRSNLLFYRSRSDDAHDDIISCARQDVLVRYGETFKLVERYVILDQSSIHTHNFAFLL